MTVLNVTLCQFGKYTHSYVHKLKISYLPSPDYDSQMEMHPSCRPQLLECPYTTDTRQPLLTLTQRSANPASTAKV